MFTSTIRGAFSPQNQRTLEYRIGSTLKSSGILFYSEKRRFGTHCSSAGGISDDLLVNVAFGWGIGGTDMASLVDSLAKATLLKDKRAISAMKQVDRAWFIPESSNIGPYENRPHSFPLKRSGPNAEVAISTPQMHSQVLEALAPAVEEGSRCLDIGCGSGYVLAVLSVLAGRKGFALGVDLHGEVLEDIAPGCLKRAGLCYSNIELLSGDINDGLDRSKIIKNGPFDIIHFGAAAHSRTKLHPILQEVLSPGGRMVCPIISRGQEQQLVQFDKAQSGDQIEESMLGTVMCAPLTSLKELERCGEKISSQQRLEKVKTELSQWKQQFKDRHGRSPSKEDMLSSSQAKALFTEFSKLNRRNWQ